MKILIAEDESAFRLLLSAHLKRMGHSTFAALNGKEAVELAVSHQPDLIFMDLNMPVLDGWAAIKQLKRKSQTAKIPIICISGIGSEGIKEHISGYGVADFLFKPFGVAELFEKIAAFSNECPV